eukprot:4923893-Prymnesium_polylepis.1
MTNSIVRVNAHLIKHPLAVGRIRLQRCRIDGAAARINHFDHPVQAADDARLLHLERAEHPQAAAAVVHGLVDGRRPVHHHVAVFQLRGVRRGALEARVCWRRLQRLDERLPDRERAA